MDIVQGLWGAAKSAVSQVPVADPDFADFATAASPLAPSHAAPAAFTAAASAPPAPMGPLSFFAPSMTAMAGRPYTKWYRVWERVTIADFYQELIILPIILAIALLHLWGAQVNRSRAKKWAVAHLPLLEAEFASVGFKGRPNSGEGVTKALEKGGSVSEDLLKQKAKNEFFTYATGRQNVAYVDVKLSLHKRYSPFTWAGETILAFFFDSIPAPAEKMEATAVCFDGHEKDFVPQASGGKGSTYDGFVWAIVHKDKMKKLRDNRYDISLTATRDHPKLPDWTTVMSESAEITDALLTPDLIKAVNDAGEDLEALIITDQPVDAPKKLDDLIPQKRIYLSTKLNPAASTASAIFQYFLRLPDILVSTGHFRPEAMRKIKATREEETRKIRKVDEKAAEEERREKGDKLKKDERERKLKGMSAEEQRKFLDKEREMEKKRAEKKRTTRA